MMSKLRSSLRAEIRTIKLLLYRRLYVDKKNEKKILDIYHNLYYDARLFGGTHGDTYWLGSPIYKCPNDLICYQEIIYETKPDVIIETGTMDGGSALFLATMCDLVGGGRVITIDIAFREGQPNHPKLTYVLGSSVAKEIVANVTESIRPSDRVMVILDSDHRKHHVLEEMQIWSKIVSPGCYMIVEDTNMNGHPVAPEFGPGPMEAVDEFLRDNNGFEIDEKREKFLLTFNPRGYLRKTR